ncbi:quinon protein alcohol dehydrogenase-like superfamily [Mrakia frigida]|uniref:F-box/WD repeat-containing protein n=1 Tax=Mrakia frigida TaxID=29902 RepID=UPI003FCBFBD9
MSSRPSTPSSQLHFNFPPSSSSSSVPFTLRDSVCERPPPHADNAADAPDFGLFRAGKKLCVRHEKMADEGINAQLQNSLDVLPLADRQAINAVWSTFSGSSHPRREIILKGLLTMCCFSQLSLLSTQVHNLIRLDPFALFPREVSLKVLSYLDAFSLGMAVQVSKDWKTLADDDLLWRGMCVQHIERKCTKCGWGLPLLERRRLRLEIDGQTDSAPTSSPSSPALDPSSPYFHSHADSHSHHHNHDSYPHIPASADYPTYNPTPLHQSEASSSSSLPQIGPLQITGSASISEACSSSSTPYNAVASSSRGRSRTKRSSPPSDDEDESDIPCSSSSSNFLLPPNPYSTSQPNKRRQPHSASAAPGRYSASPSVSPPPPPSSLYPLLNPTARPSAPRRTVTRPWKEVYTERLTIERNWRKGRYTARVFKGHTDGVMCLQVMEGETARAEGAGPSCGKSSKAKGEGEGVLITGSYDRTARVWDLETGEEVMVLRGHARGIRALQFDSAILITGSMDHTMKIWNWRTGVCIRTLAGHTDGIVCLNYDKNVLASGSADSTIKIWNFRNGDCFTLRGHRDWVNSVVLWDGTTNAHEPEWSSTSSLLSSSSSTSPPHPSSSNSSAPAVDPGKMLFSGSDDGTIRLWDLSTRECVKVMEGHVGQVQSMRLVIVDREKEDDESEEEGLGIMRGPSVGDVEMEGRGNQEYEPNPLGVSGPFSHPLPIVPGHVGRHHHHHGAQQEPATTARSSSSLRNEVGGGGGAGGGGKQAILVSASLDNTVKVWDVETGKSKKTLFGHIEGVWGVDVDPLRVVSSSHDRTIKVWSRDDGKCTQTLVGHRGAVTCLQLTDTQILSGSDDGEVRVWNFGASAAK